ncbi:MAG: hypothetical protein GKS05_12730 [Nitrospirales bacterium]|nr:hypothetical protein [Nitrospirales bacterium]
MGDQSYAAGRFAFGIDGQSAGFIKKFSGGVIKGEVVTHDLGTSPIQRKHLATISHEPLTLDVTMGMGKGLWDWIQASWDKGFIQKNCELQACDFNHKVKAVRVFQDAYIKKVVVPTMDSSSKDAGYFTIELDPRIIRYEKGTGETIKGNEDIGAKKWLCSNFRFELGGLPTDRVAKIDSFSWGQKVVKDEIGSFREPIKETSSLMVTSNLKLSISIADYWPWFEWFKSFVIDGKYTDGDEKQGSLTFLAPDLKEELGSISFEHVGIISLEEEAVEANTESVACFVVELYCESMAFNR